MARLLRLGLTCLALGAMLASPAVNYAKPPDLPGSAPETGTPQVDPDQEQNNQILPLFATATNEIRVKKSRPKPAPKGSMKIEVGVSAGGQKRGLFLPSPFRPAGMNLGAVYVGWQVEKGNECKPTGNFMVGVPGWLGWLAHRAHVKQEVRMTKVCQPACCEKGDACEKPDCCAVPVKACGKCPCEQACRSIVVCQPARCTAESKCSTPGCPVTALLRCCGQVGGCCAKQTLEVRTRTGCEVQRRWLLHAFKNAVRTRRFEKAAELADQILALEEGGTHEVKAESCPGCPVHRAVQFILFGGAECKCSEGKKCGSECKCVEGKACSKCTCTVENKCQCSEGKKCCEECKCSKGKACSKCTCSAKSECKCSDGKKCAEGCKCSEGKKCPKCKCGKTQEIDIQFEKCPCPKQKRQFQSYLDVGGMLQKVMTTTRTTKKVIGPNNQPVTITVEEYLGEQFIPWHADYDVQYDVAETTRASGLKTHCADWDLKPASRRFSYRFGWSGETYEVRYDRSGWKFDKSGSR